MANSASSSFSSALAPLTGSVVIVASGPPSCIGNRSDPDGSTFDLPGRAQSNLNPDRTSSINVTDGGRQHLGDERRQGVGGVAVKGMPRAVVAAGGIRVGVAGRILDIAQRDPSANAMVTMVCRRLCGVMCGVMCLASPAGRASRATIRAASWRSSRPPVLPPAAGRRCGHRAPHRLHGRSAGPAAPACAGHPCPPPRVLGANHAPPRGDECGRRGSGGALPPGPRSGRSRPGWPAAGQQWRGSGRLAPVRGCRPRCACVGQPAARCPSWHTRRGSRGGRPG
jgi:hypothetical protein